MDNKQPLKDFLNHWQSFPQASTYCLEPEVLMALSEKSEAEWDDKQEDHLKVCDHCREVVKLLRGQTPQGSLYDFLEMTRERAQVEKSGGPRWLEQFWPLSPNRRPAWRSVSLAASLVLLVVVWASSDQLLQLSRPGNEVAKVSFPEDSQYKSQRVAAEYAQNLNESVDRLRKSPASIEELQRYGEEFNTKAEEINKLVVVGQLKGKPYQTWKASEADFTTIYNRRLELVMNRTDAKAASMPSIPMTQEAQTAEALYANIARALSDQPLLKKNEGENLSLQPKQAINDIRVGSENVLITSNEGGVLTVQEQKPKRNPAEIKKLENAINETVKDRGLTVKFIVGGKSVNLTPQSPVASANAWYPQP